MTKTVTLEQSIQKVTVGIPGPPGATAPTFSSVTFDTGADEPASPAQGELWWNPLDLTLNLKQNGSTLQIGLEDQWAGRNTGGAEITNGTPVRVTGTLGGSGRGKIGEMDATDTANSVYYVGLATETMANNGDGKVTDRGLVRDIDTTGAPYSETWEEGELIYLDPVNVGKLTNVPPNRYQVSMPCAFVIYKHASSGILAVRTNSRDEHVHAIRVATTAQLADITSPANTNYKEAGGSIFNTTTSKPVWAVGSTAASVWVDATGSTVHTPV
jgi:hypothetical protein